VDTGADAALLRIAAQRRRLLFCFHVAATVPDELIDGRHNPSEKVAKYPCKIEGELGLGQPLTARQQQAPGMSPGRRRVSAHSSDSAHELRRGAACCAPTRILPSDRPPVRPSARQSASTSSGNGLGTTPGTGSGGGGGGSLVGGLPPFFTTRSFASEKVCLSTFSPSRNSVSPGSTIFTFCSIWRTITPMCLSLIFTPCSR